jgi:hypothetical protein
MFDINFNILFAVQIQHAYYNDSNNACPDFIIIPSAETANILSGYDMIWKQYGNMLYIGSLTKSVLIDPNNNTLPVSAPAANERFTFYMQCKNPLFYNFTDMPLDSLSGNILYLTNRNNNTVNAAPNLTVANPNNSVSAADLVPINTGTFNYPLSPPLASGTVTVTDFYTNAVVATQLFTTLPGQNSVPVDLSVLDTGKYKISVAGQAAYAVYYSSDFSGSNYSGVIEIFNDPTLPAGYQLFGAGGVFLSPQYVVSFLNRATTWKYILLSGTTGNITDAASIYTFNSTGNVLTSATAIPLTKKPITLKLSYTGYPGLTPVTIPNPCIDRLAVKDIPHNQYYSEIYLNY